jgi:hypothetical protein
MRQLAPKIYGGVQSVLALLKDRVKENMPAHTGALKRGIKKAAHRTIWGAWGEVYSTGVKAHVFEANPPASWTKLPDVDRLERWVNEVKGEQGSKGRKAAWAIALSILRKGIRIPTRADKGQMYTRAAEWFRLNSPAVAHAFKDGWLGKGIARWL